MDRVTILLFIIANLLCVGAAPTTVPTKAGRLVSACSCQLLVETTATGIDLTCDGTCLMPADNCDLHTEWTNDGGIITTCACYPTPDSPYSCGDTDCEAGYEWAPGPGAAFTPVGARCWTVDCRAVGGCQVKAPPYATPTHPCDC